MDAKTSQAHQHVVDLLPVSRWKIHLVQLIQLGDAQAEHLCGGGIASRISGLAFLAGRGDSIFNQLGPRNTANVGSTGFSLLSIGAIYL